MNIQSYSQVAPTFDYKATINSEMLKVESAASQIHTDVEANNSSYTPGQTMSFQFPTSMNVLADMERTTIYFSHTISDNISAGNKSLSIADDASSLFDTVEVFVNNVSLGPLYNYNLAKSIVNSITITDEVRDGPLSIYGGFGQTPVGASSYTTKYYAVQLTMDCLFGKTSRLLPLFLLSNLEVRIRLASPDVCLVRVATDTDPNPSSALTTYTVGNPVMRVFGKQINDVDRNTLTQAFLKSGLQILTTAWEHYPVNWGSQANSSVSIDTRKQSVKAAVVVFRSNTILDSSKFASNVSVADTSNCVSVGTEDSSNKLNTFDGRITKYYFQVGADRFPQNFDIDSKAMALFETHNAFHGQCVGYRVKPTLWDSTTSTTSFVISRDFETSHTGALVSGLSNSSKQKSDIKLRILSTASTTNNLRGDAFVHYDKMIYISPRGSVKIVE